MNNPNRFFHIVSYLQYPLLIPAFYFYVLFMFSLAGTPDWVELNKVLVFYGLSISLSTLQDTSKTQNKFSKRIWEDPRKGKIMLLGMSLMTLIFIASGLIGIINNEVSIHKEISLGLMVLGIGLIGMLKGATEMFEYHRLDKNNSSKV